MAESEFSLTTSHRVKNYLKLDDGNISTSDSTLIERMIDAVTAKIERACDRRFKTRTWVETISGNGAHAVWVKNIPVESVVSVRVGFEDALVVDSANSTAVGATVQVTYEKDEASTNVGKPKNLILTIIGGGDAGTDTIDLTVSTTITAVATAIGAVGKGWTSTVLAEFENAPSDILRETAGVDVFESQFNLEVYDDPDDDFWVDFIKGTVTRIGGFHRDVRNIRVEYTAGEDPIPNDLAQIATEMVSMMFQKRDKDLSVKKESLGDYSYELGDIEEIAKTFAPRLAPFLRLRLG